MTVLPSLNIYHLILNEFLHKLTTLFGVSVGMDTRGKFTAMFVKEGNFCDFLFCRLVTGAHSKQEANPSLLANFDRVTPEVYLLPLKQS